MLTNRIGKPELIQFHTRIINLMRKPQVEPMEQRSEYHSQLHISKPDANTFPGSLCAERYVKLAHLGGFVQPSFGNEVVGIGEDGRVAMAALGLGGDD